MSRKDHIALAKALAAIKPDYDTCPTAAYTMWSNCVHSIAQALNFDNVRFDHGRFYSACGLPTKE
jgi:hypothetical protein